MSFSHLASGEFVADVFQDGRLCHKTTPTRRFTRFYCQNDQPRQTRRHYYSTRVTIDFQSISDPVAMFFRPTS